VKFTELYCTYDPLTRSGSGFNARKVKSTIQWVSKECGVPAELHLYDRLLKESAVLAESGNDWKELLNPASLIRVEKAILEPSMKNASSYETYQFIRHGYFCLDNKHAHSGQLVFNRVVPLKDSWKRQNSDILK